jgi:hypothetical protein
MASRVAASLVVATGMGPELVANNHQVNKVKRKVNNKSLIPM